MPILKQISHKETITDAISEATKRISQALNPEKIFLFGSHAWGVPTPNSDIDLFIIIKDSDQPPYRRASKVYRSLRGMRAPIEVVVRTSEEVKKSNFVKTSLANKVLSQGKLLYGQTKECDAMIDLEKYQSEIDRICQRYHVKKLTIFGSALSDQFEESSDIDFLLELKTTDGGIKKYMYSSTREVYAA